MISGSQFIRSVLNPNGEFDEYRTIYAVTGFRFCFVLKLPVKIYLHQVQLCTGGPISTVRITASTIPLVRIEDHYTHVTLLDLTCVDSSAMVNPFICLIAFTGSDI